MGPIESTARTISTLSGIEPGSPRAQADQVTTSWTQMGSHTGLQTHITGGWRSEGLHEGGGKETSPTCSMQSTLVPAIISLLVDVDQISYP